MFKYENTLALFPVETKPLPLPLETESLTCTLAMPVPELDQMPLPELPITWVFEIVALPLPATTMPCALPRMIDPMTVNFVAFAPALTQIPRPLLPVPVNREMLQLTTFTFAALLTLTPISANAPGKPRMLRFC